MKNNFIEGILASGVVIDRNGTTHSLHSAISQQEGEFIWNLITTNNVTSSIEVGCAFGISSLYICDALSRQDSPQHVIVDAYQSTDWHSVGTYNLEKAGFRFWNLIEEPSELALPKLLHNGVSFEFALVDGWHTFDHTLVDFFYLNRLLNVGGIIVFDDVTYPAVKKVIDYVLKYPSYERVDSVHVKRSWKRKLLKPTKRLISIATMPIPDRLAQEIFDGSIVTPDTAVDIDIEMIALRKTAEDKRSYDWYRTF